jgi:DNA-binding CsgD family transcriptional regulator
LRRRRRAPDVKLTKREKDILRLLSIGHSTREISKKLSIGSETIRTHLKNAARKLGTRSRVHMVLEALRLGLLD